MWEVIGSIAGVLSFIFAVYVFIKAKSDEITEKAKTELLKQRIGDIHTQLIASMHSVDAIVQIGKQDNASVEMLQNMARITRGNLYTTIKRIEKERELLHTWKYGKMVHSEEIEPEKKTSKND
ncbi:hypothetical protein KQH61_00705 [bacterium]|nr:hypothetical protein [bacterium]